MIRIISYDTSYRNIWNDFIKKSKNGIFMFNRHFMDYHSDRFTDSSLLFYDENELIALLPANIRDNTLYSHQGLTYGGFITNSQMKQHKMNDCVSALVTYMQKNQIKKLLYKPLPHIYNLQPAEEDLYSLFLNNARLLWVKPATVYQYSNPCKMPKGRKAQISRAKREGVIIESSNNYTEFINLENKVLMKYHNAKAVHTADELSLLKSSFDKEIQLYVAKYNNEIIAGAILFVYANVIHTQYLAANDKSREIGALDLLIKTLIDKYADTKVYFDFGTSVETDEKVLNEGLISQKEGFGGRSVGYCCWEIIVE